MIQSFRERPFPFVLFQQIVVLLALLFAAPRARAQDFTSDVYTDAKDIITELIERDLAESLSAELACYSPRGLLKYFPTTLQAVFERNFGAVKDQLKSEASWFAANYAFECFRQKRTIPLAEFLPLSAFNPLGADNSCPTRVKELGGPTSYQATLASHAAARGEVYYPIHRCAQQLAANEAGLPGSESELVAAVCPFITALVSTQSRPKDALAAVVESAATSAFKRWSFNIRLETQKSEKSKDLKALNQVLPGVEEIQIQLFGELVKRVNTGAFAPEDLLAGFGSKQLTDDFKIPTDFTSVFSATNGQRIDDGALLLLLRPHVKPSLLVDGRPEVSLVEQVHASWFASLAPQAGDSPGVTLARALLAHAGIAAQGTVRVEAVGGGLTFKVDEVAEGKAATSAPVFVGAGLARLVDLQQMARRALELGRVITALGAPIDKQAELIVRATIGLVQFIDQSAKALKAIPRNADGSIDAITLLNAVLTPDRQNGFCANPAQPVGVPVQRSAGVSDAKLDSKGTEPDPSLRLSLCGILQQAFATADPENVLRPILSAAVNRDYRRVAMAATDAVFSRASVEAMCCERGPECTRTAEMYGRLAKSIVSYVLMPRGDEDQSIAARAAFKSAAIDVLREVGKRGGVERKSPWWFLLPTFSLRASWSGSYQVSDPDGRTVRFVPTVDFPSIRLRLTREGATPYVGLSLSGIDGLAPFAEVVSRNEEVAQQLQHDRTWAVVATAIHPRASVLVAMPALTKNTALVLSGGLRGSAIFRSREPEGSYEYATLWAEPDKVGGNFYWSFVEVSAGVQYVP